MVSKVSFDLIQEVLTDNKEYDPLVLQELSISLGLDPVVRVAIRDENSDPNAVGPGSGLQYGSN